MLVLQASLEVGQLFLWGETRASESEVPVKRRGRRPKSAPVPLFPYNPGAELILTWSEAVPGFKVDSAAVQERILWLPAMNGQPVASSPLIAEPPGPDTTAVLSPWTVRGLLCTAEQAVDVLGACIGKDVLAPGVVIGKTLAFCAAGLRFAAALVAREQFLPDLDETSDPPRARWKPILAGPDAQRAQQLAQAMPASCRALTDSTDQPPTTPALEVLTAFVETLVDALVRSALSPVALAAQRRTPSPTRFDSVHEQWLHALRSADGAVPAAKADQLKLAEQVRTWQRPIAVATATPFRLCFRLEEPASHDGKAKVSTNGSWYVRYLLQAADDPSLLLPAEDAWSARGRKAALLKRRRFDAHEYLLTALGQASRIDPSVEESLKTAAPGGYPVDVSGAHAFLTERSWLLEQAGFGVLLPAWWTRKGTKLRLTARAHVTSPKMQGGSGLGLMDLVQFDWQVALGDQTLTRAELETLARLKQPLVQVRGQWVQLSAEEIQAALEYWKKHPTGEATVREVVQMALGAARTPGSLAFDGVTATGWIKGFLDQLEGQAAFEELPLSDRFQGTLRPYQVRGYSWLGFLRRWGLGACLADDMGLGKTVQTLALLQRDWHDRPRPTLLICPMSVVGNWHKEAARFTPELPVMVHHGQKRQKGESFRAEAQRHALVVSSYALLHRDFELFREVDWAGVILDEAQNIKNPETKQARSARALPVEYRVALTGTPVENHIGDLWSIMEFLNPGFLGTQPEFKRRFFIPIQAGHDPEATERLKRLTGPFVLRRLKTDKSIIADLPDKLEMKVFCTLTQEQASLYEAVVREAEKALARSEEGIQRKGVILATLSKLKQVCNHPAQFLGDNSALPGRSGKLARLTEMLEEALQVGDRALIFTQFREMGELIQRHMEETFGQEVLFLHGGVPKKQRDYMVERFQADDGPRLFLLSLKAGGTGLNLTAANHVFHFDRWWNPAVEQQATDRAFRIGQTRNVQVHKFLCVGTLEEKIDEMIERKQAVAATVVGTGEGWLTELSNEQLKDLFTLRHEALGE
jgi:SNF2 family DNA or RNA helicase